MSDKLIPKHQEFINELFLLNMNATEAYLKVYPKSSYDAARAHAARLVTNGSIQAEIARRLKEKQLSADEVLARLGDMARADMRDFIKAFEIGEKTAVMVDLGKALEGGKTHLIKKLKYNAQGGLEIELHDSQAALLNIGKNHGLFTDKIELKLEKEMDAVLEIAEKVLDADNYQRLLQAITGNAAGSTEAPESGEDSQGDYVAD